MILWIILIVIAILVLFILWWISGNETMLIEIDNYPTVHARCRSDSTCGGDLTCDLHCNRCRKKIGGDCSADNDCESGLICRNWKCSTESNSAESNSAEPNSNKSNTLEPNTNKSNNHIVPSKQSTNKGVHWDETKNSTHYF